jgi:PadR family transcriptional regulator PadR
LAFYPGLGGGLGLGLGLGPGVVGADVPEVAFEVAAGEGAATVVHVADVEDHLGGGGFGGGVDGVGVVDDEVDAFGLAETDLVRLNHEPAVFATAGALFGNGAEHDHAVAEGELRVQDGGVVGAEVDGLFFEAEGADEPVDGGEGVAVAKAGDDGGTAGFGLVGHGFRVSLRLGWRLGRIGRGAPLPLTTRKAKGKHKRQHRQTWSLLLLPLTFDRSWRILLSNVEGKMAATSDLLQGTLDLLILRTLALESMHGWGIAQRIQQVSKDALQIGQGSLYPALHRLEYRGWIRADWGASENNRRAKFYSLTVTGRAQLKAELKDWERLTTAIGLVLKQV